MTTTSNIKAKATVIQANKAYTKFTLSKSDKDMLQKYGHVGRWNHYVFDTPHVRVLSDAGKVIRTAARRGECLIVGDEYYVRNYIM